MAQHAGRLRIAAALALAGSLLLGGCAASSTSDETADAGDVVDIALPGSLSSLYPGQEAGILNYYVASIAQEGLVSVGADGSIQPGLAESWEQPDASTYVYRLRDDARFQDGSPVTADDVVFSIERALDAEASPSFAGWLSNIDTYAATGEDEITITLKEPDTGFSWLPSTAGALFVTSRAWTEEQEAAGGGDGLILGSGPYRVTEFVPDSYVDFERVDTWWNGVPEVERLHITFVPDESTRLLAWQGGDLDLAFNVPLTQAAQWEKVEGADVRYVPDLSYVGLAFDTSLPPFDDPHVRRAIGHSLDRDAVVDTILRGHGEAATAVITPESLGSVWSADESRERLGDIPQLGFDLDAARAELAQSSVPGGFQAELLFPATGPQLGDAAQTLAQNLAEIGIDLTVTEVPIEQWFGTLGDGEHGIGFTWYFSTTGDPAELVSFLLGDGNSANYANADAQALLAQARGETDPTARAELLVAANAAAAPDAAYVPLWWGQSATAFGNGLTIADDSPFTFVGPWAASLSRAE